MDHGQLDDAIAELGPIPAACRFAVDEAYAYLRRLIATQAPFSQYSVQLYRRLIHDHAWIVLRELLVERPECRFIPEAGTEVLQVNDKYLFQFHKVDDLLRVADNGTRRALDIQGQGYLWQIGMVPKDGEIWLTVGHTPNPFTHVPERVVVGVAIEGGMTQFRHIDPAPHIVASIGPQAAEAVRRILGGA